MKNDNSEKICSSIKDKIFLKGGFGMASNNNDLFGGLFDFNGDGKTDL